MRRRLEAKIGVLDLDIVLERPQVPVGWCCKSHFEFASQIGEDLMTETQGWIAIVLAQLVMVGSEMRGLRQTSRIDAPYRKFFGTD